ncbi:MAG: hypothetical protein MJ097_00585 [Dorea sp.]|nr:hypothetical protein [Dorea sp.]
MAREIFNPTINEGLDVQFTALCQIHGLKKEATVNEVLQAWADSKTAETTLEQIATYALAKKMDQESQQWMREELTRKIVGGMQQ